LARIFLSHSSADNFEALAVRDWLVAEGWDDVFLDISTTGGISAADRWERSLHEAANRCEAVVFLVSRAWLASQWCLREFNLAVRLNKRLFGVLIEDIPVAELRSEMTAWQVINLAHGQDGVIRRAVMETGEEKHVTFSRAGLAKLKFGLQRAGLDPRFFEWPPKHDPDRPPYRGMKPLEADDAGIFFGREAQVIEALDRLRGLADAAPPRFLAILGASGAGKSSFMRAGLLPRLERDDRNFLALPVIRPERAVISGDTGLVASLEEALKRAGQPKSRAEIKSALAAGAKATANLLAALAESARAPQLDAAEPPTPPAIVIAVDQGEELFSAEGKSEAEALLALLASLLTAGTTPIPAGNEPAPSSEAPNLSTALPLPHQPVGERWPSQYRGGDDAAGHDQPAAILAGPEWRTPSETLTTAARIILLVTIRSDSYEALQTAPQLEGIRQSTFSLPPLAKGAFQLVIEGPSVRLRDTNRPLRIEPALTQALLADVEADTSKDALPLLAFTLERLWREHGTTGDLKLGDYRTMGGVKGSIEAAVERVMKAAETDPDLRNVADRPALLRRAIIPWLATIDRETNMPRRRVARLSEIPVEAQPFIHLLVAERLLSTEQVFDATGAKQGAITVEPAHEALLRQWGQLQQWLDEEGAAYAAIDGIKRAAVEWKAHARDEAWLAHQAGRLEDAERVAARDDFGSLLTQQERDYLVAARIADTVRRGRELEEAKKLAEEQRKSADAMRLVAIHQKKVANRTRLGLAGAVVLAVAALGAALYGFWQAEQADIARVQEEQKTREAKANETISLDALSRAALAERRPVDALKLALSAWPRVGDEERPPMRATSERLSSALSELRHETTMVGHENHVASAAFSPDGSRVVSASRDNTARIWDAATGAMLLTLRGHTSTVRSAAFSSDGARVITASYDGTARFWNAATGAELSLLKGHEDAVSSAAFSADGHRVLTASWDKTARVWDTTTATSLLELRGHEGPVKSASFSPDGNRIVTASDDKTVRIWDATTGGQLMVLKGHDSAVTWAVFSPDGSRIATASEDTTVRVWDAQTGSVVLVLRDGRNEMLSAAFSPDGMRIATASRANSARVWDAYTGAELLELKGHTWEVSSVAFSPDGARIVTASGDHTARVWDAAVGSDQLRFKAHEEQIQSAAFAPDAGRIVTASLDDTARIWDAATGSQMLLLAGHQSGVWSASYSPDGLRIVTASWDRTARVWDAVTGIEILKLQTNSSPVRSASYSSDGRRIVTALDDKTARVWNAATGSELLQLKGHTREVQSAAFSPDGKRIVTASLDGTARVWDADLGAELLSIKGHQGNVFSASFSPDGSLIVTASEDSSVRVWNAGTAAELMQLRGHKSAVRSAVFSHDGTRIATASSDLTVRLWDTATGAELLLLKGHEGPVYSVAFSGDDRSIVSSSLDNTVRVWDISSAIGSGNAFQVACNRMANNTDLSDVEARYGLSKLTPICGDHPPLPVDQAKLQ
jgi:WD40 repeat protein